MVCICTFFVFPYPCHRGAVKSVYVCPFVHIFYATKLLNRIQLNIMHNQMTVMCTAHGERTIISVKYQTECVERKLDEQTDSHSGYSTHLRVERKYLNCY